MINEELLAAYAEGALAPADRIKVEAAAARDPSIARRLMDQVGRRRRTPAATVAGPVPRRRAGDAAAAMKPFAGAVVVDLASVRASKAKAAPPPRAAAEWRTFLSPAVATTFLAASLVAGLGIGAILTAQPTRPQVVDREGALYADGALAQALKAQQAGRVGPVLVGPVEKAADGRPCRIFRFRAPTGLAGVACSLASGWRLEMTLADDGRPSPTGSIFPPGAQAALEDLARRPVP